MPQCAFNRVGYNSHSARSRSYDPACDGNKDGKDGPESEKADALNSEDELWAACSTPPIEEGPIVRPLPLFGALVN